MNRVEHVAWAAADRGVRRDGIARGRAPVELLLVAIATAGELLGAVTHPLIGTTVAVAIAVALTAGYVSAEVRALRACEPAGE